jgi:hypothetical protein
MKTVLKVLPQQVLRRRSLSVSCKDVCSIVTRLRAVRPRFDSRHCVQTSSAAHSASYSVGTGAHSPGGKAATAITDFIYPSVRRDYTFLFVILPERKEFLAHVCTTKHCNHFNPRVLSSGNLSFHRNEKKVLQSYCRKNFNKVYITRNIQINTICKYFGAFSVSIFKGIANNINSTVGLLGCDAV